MRIGARTSDKYKDEESKINTLIKQSHGINNKTPLDIIVIAQSFGFEVGNGSFNHCIESCCFDFKDGQKILNQYQKAIVVNRMLSAKEKRFYIAYELCRYLIESSLDENYAHVNINESDEKYELLSMRLLLPEEEFRETTGAIVMYCRKGMERVDFLSAHFAVDKDVIIQRMVELGL